MWGEKTEPEAVKKGYHRYWVRNTEAWGYTVGPSPSIDSLPRLYQLVAREALGYLNHRFPDNRAITLHAVKRTYDLRDVWGSYEYHASSASYVEDNVRSHRARFA